MNIDKLIKILQEKRKTFGKNIECFTNGKDGIREIVSLEDNSIDVSSACSIGDFDHLIKDDSDIVCHIGGN